MLTAEIGGLDHLQSLVACSMQIQSGIPWRFVHMIVYRTTFLFSGQRVCVLDCDQLVGVILHLSLSLSLSLMITTHCVDNKVSPDLPQPGVCLE